MATTTKLTTILASDVCGYSKMIGEDEFRAIAALQECRKIMDPLIQEYGGRIFNTAGDAVLAEFHSPVLAVGFAIKCQQQFLARNRMSGKLPMRWRFGINLGEVYAQENGDLLGDGVNIAARLESIADQGGVAIGAEVYGLSYRKLKEVMFEDRGEIKLKNISSPIQVWSIKIEGSVRSAEPQQNQTPDKKKIEQDIKALEPSAEQLDGDAALKLGRIYADKTSPFFNIGKAVNWFWLARARRVGAATEELNAIIKVMPKDEWNIAKSNAEVFLDDLRWKAGIR